VRLPLLLFVALAGCSREARDLGPSRPQTAPLGDRDPRIATYQQDFQQLSQGARYFSYYGCQTCHDESAPGWRNLSDGRWHRGDGFAQVYGAIAGGHGALRYGARIPVEQLWQLTAYTRDLPEHFPEKRQRTALDQRAEPQGARWSGPQ